jgi:hypothetical protein
MGTQGQLIQLPRVCAHGAYRRPLPDEQLEYIARVWRSLGPEVQGYLHRLTAFLLTQVQHETDRSRKGGAR